MGCVRRPALGVWDTGVESLEDEVSKTEGPGERLTLYVLLQLSKVFRADEALLFGHLSSLPETDHRDCLLERMAGRRERVSQIGDGEILPVGFPTKN